MASKIRQVLLNIATMMAFNKLVTKKMRFVDLIGRVLSQGGSQGLVLPGPQGVASTPQGPPFVRNRVIVPSSNKRQQPRVVLT
jgi:hypothetical protein